LYSNSKGGQKNDLQYCHVMTQYFRKAFGLVESLSLFFSMYYGFQGKSCTNLNRRATAYYWPAVRPMPPPIA
jgi:hypothetical protein